jgi:lysophospholipase L1-like esterase
VSSWRSHFYAPSYVFCGDSITAGARCFGLSIGATPFSDLNLGESGYTVLQIRSEVQKALKKHAKSIFIMAGTNDILQGRSTLDQTVKDYDDMLALFLGSQSVPIITLVPLTTDSAQNKSINSLNSKILNLAEKYNAKVIDLNPELAPKNQLLPIFTLDGVHLTTQAYEIWASKIRKILYK